MNSPSISIIIPVYNAEKYLPACLTSILSQSFRDFEIVLVDDGSVDGSLALINEWAHKDGRVKVFHKANGGVSSARNLGLSKASGEYVTFVDADDELPTGALEKLMSETGDGIDFVMGGYEMYDEDGNLTYAIEERSEKTVSREEGIRQMYKPSPYMYWGFICSKLFKTNIIRKHKIAFDLDIKFNEDRLFIVRYLTSQKGDVRMFTEPVYKYILRGSGAMTSMNSGFNPAFVTDFVATVRMKDIIKKRFAAKELRQLSYDGILTSYSTIHDRMSRNGGVDPKIHRYLFWNMIKNIPLPYLFKRLRNK